MSVEIFGELKHAGSIEAAAEAQLRLWLPSYLQEARTQAGHGPIAPIKSWGVASDYERFPEKGLPALIISAPGTVDDAERTGGARYDAEWELEIDVTFAAASGGAARLAAQIYGAAIRGVMSQKPALAGDITVLDWKGEITSNVPTKMQRTQVAVANLFRVGMNGVVTAQPGPTSPTATDTELPEITDVDLEASPTDD
jgi:hypothetical protein